jgi:hypothetical protein
MAARTRCSLGETAGQQDVNACEVRNVCSHMVGRMRMQAEAWWPGSLEVGGFLRGRPGLALIS